MAVYKDLKNNNIFSSLGLPSFTRDWLLKRFEDEEGNFDIDELSDFVRRFIPRRNDWNAIKSRIVKDHERVKMLTKLSIEVDVRQVEVSFALPDLGLSAKETIIEDSVWQNVSVWRNVKEELVSGQEVWGMIELGYRDPDDSVKPRLPGKTRLVRFQNFCPYTINLDFYKDVRDRFTTGEWLDILLGAIDYNAAGYRTEEQKLTMLTRLLPFVEKRLNLIKWLPKGQENPISLDASALWLAFLRRHYERSETVLRYFTWNRELMSTYDFVTLDEVQTISFTDVDEMRAALKGYLESGEYTVGNHKGIAWAGMILCGNISKSVMDNDATTDMFTELPAPFHESALLERFHGFIKGWNIPRMNDDLKINGWALNSEYFCSILHELRGDSSYRAIVDRLIEVPDGADTRDTEAVKRIATAYLKLIFPNVRHADEIKPREFNRYCLRRACIMRSIIVNQMALMDREYAGKEVPRFTVRSL